MATLIVRTRDQEERTLEGQSGFSLMEIIRAAGIDELLALCGGCCSCATCHVYIEPRFIGRLTPMSADEDSLLDMSEHRRATSRLSCQISFTAALDGLELTLAPEE